MSYNGQFQMLIKMADQFVTNTTVLTSDNELRVKLEAGRTYTLDSHMHVITTSGEFKFSVNYSGTVTHFHGMVHDIADDATPHGDTSVWSAVDTVHTMSGGGGMTAAHITMHLAVGASSAGTLTLKWAQNTADASSTIVKAGSHIAIREL